MDSDLYPDLREPDDEDEEYVRKAFVVVMWLGAFAYTALIVWAIRRWA